MNKEIRLGPGQKRLGLNELKEIWQYREMLWALSWRDIKIRYRETVLGVIWVLFQPTVVTTIFSVIFGKLAKIPSDNLPYPLFTYSGIILWNFFSAGIYAVSNSLSGASGLIQKVNFPRLILPFSAILVVFVDFLVSFIPLAVMGLYFGVYPHLEILFFLPFLVLFLVIFTVGAGMILAPIFIYYRDVRYLLNFLLQIGLFVTPVIYPLSAVYGWKKWVLIINPLTGLVETFRALFKPDFQIDFPILSVSIIVSLGLFILGLVFYHRRSREIVDYL